MKIISRIESLRAREHEATVLLIQALLECDESCAHITLGYSSMWDFLVGHLRYSNAAASRRYKAMKCAREFPAVLAMLRKHETNLSALAAVEATLSRAENPEELLGQIRGRSQAQVERVLSRQNPRPKKRETIRRVAVKPRPAARPAPDMFTTAGVRTSESTSSGAEVRTSETATSAPEVNNGRNESARTSAAEVRTSETRTSAPELEDRVQLGFTVTAETFEQFQRAQAILSRKHPKGLSLEQAFEELLGFYLKHRGPRPKKSKSGQKTQRTAKSTKRSAAHSTTNLAYRTTHRTTRHIPAAIRREVFERDGHRCTYEGPTGRRCDSAHDLQLDHIHPWGCGGATNAENLRVLCSTHNRHRNLTTKEPAPRYAGLHNRTCLPSASAPEVNNGRTRSQSISAPELPPDHAPAPAAEPAPAVVYLTRNQNPNGTSAPPITSHLPRPANPFLPRRMKIPLNGMNSSNTA